MRQGDYVKLIPKKAQGDPHHPSCDNGFVMAVQERFVFVAFTGQFLAEPVDPQLLIVLEGS